VFVVVAGIMLDLLLWGNVRLRRCQLAEVSLLSLAKVAVMALYAVSH